MNNERLAKLIADLYNVVDGLDLLFGDCKRHFTPDGHLVGSIGEAVAKHTYNLTLEQSSKAGVDATFGKSGESIQIKTTSVTSISVRFAETYADCLLVLKLDRRKGFQEIYAGRFPRELFEGKKPDKRGYFSLTLNVLKRLDVHTFVQKQKLDELNEYFLQERHG